MCAAAGFPPATARTSRLVIVNEVLGDVRAPGIEGIVRWMVSRGPVAGRGNVVDIGGVFAEASPRILNVVEVIRAEHVSAQAPALRKALFEHVRGAGADLVDRAHVPAEMMVAGGVGTREGDHVMIAAVNAVQESNIVAGMIGQPHPEHASV